MINFLLLSFLGIFFLLVAYLDVDWFLNLMKSDSYGFLLGRKFTRVMIGIIGFFYSSLLVALFETFELIYDFSN